AAGRAGSGPAVEEVAVVPWPRNERGATAGLKTISYAENVRALAYAHERGATEALFLNTVGAVCEATAPSLPPDVFLEADEAFLTPSTRELQPISHVDGTELRAVPGKVTERLTESFRALVERDLDP